MDITLIFTLLQQALPLLLPVAQTVIADFVNTARVTSPMMNPTAPAAVTAAHPYPTIKALQHAYNVLSKPAILLDEDGLWGPQTDTAIAAFLTAHGLVGANPSAPLTTG